MKLEKLVGDRFRERPSDCVVDSHALMVRGGYLKNVASGIFSSYTPLKRVTGKIERIIREEMDAIDGQEVQFPVVMPASLWQESGRYESIGREMARFHDRSGNALVLGMTHEEAAVQLVRDCVRSYSEYPFMIYQIQTKFRDEARPRAGLIRVREFTMKDAYSFHTSQADLEKYYERCHKAYERIYARAGLPEVVSVAADSGMMGGNVSHEFMLLTPVGEDSIVMCRECDYRANREAAEQCGFDMVREGGICPRCGKPAITISRGIEVGNIFQLGTKYTRSMNMTYIDQNGEVQYPVMGCYGIGIGRLAASICEAHHDEYGPIWPLAVAPWQVHLCAVRSDDMQVKAYADKLYVDLQSRGVEVIYDDRQVSAGVMFSDADLLGVPFRVIVSPRNRRQNMVEIVSRDRCFSANAPMEAAAEAIWKILSENAL
ncbi:MAG: hypothetical protein HDR26_08125 [Lachnospiraceae bacterium]|nr:hypothetical protein [Lachnospiraceae bacterium]